MRVLNAGLAIVDQPGRPMPSGFAADALRAAALLGAELKDLALPKDRAGRTVVNAASILRVLRNHQARPLAEAGEDRIPRAEIDFASGIVHLEGAVWLRPEQTIPAADVARDARILVDYLASFLSFFGNSAGAGGGVLGLPGLALRRPGGTASAPGRRSRPASIPGCTRSMRCSMAGPAAARPCSRASPRAPCSGSRR